MRGEIVHPPLGTKYFVCTYTAAEKSDGGRGGYELVVVAGSQVFAELLIDGQLDSLLGGHPAQARPEPAVETAPALLRPYAPHALRHALAPPASVIINHSPTQVSQPMDARATITQRRREGRRGAHLFWRRVLTRSMGKTLVIPTIPAMPPTTNLAPNGTFFCRSPGSVACRLLACPSSPAFV